MEWETERLPREGRWEAFVLVLLELVLELWVELMKQHQIQEGWEHCLLGEAQKRVE